MRALFPRLLEAEERHGSVIRSLRSLRTPRPPDGLFRSLDGGMGLLVAAIARALPPNSIRYGARVDRIEPPRALRDAPGAGGWKVTTADGDSIEASRVILAVPAYAAATLVADLDAELSSLCRDIPYTSTAAVVMAHPRSTVRHPLLGTGFVVPRIERQWTIMAASWVSSKWPNRAPGEQVLLRAFVGGARDPRAIDRDDDELVRQAERDLGVILGIEERPSWARVYRWERANAQHEVGHLDRIGAIEERLADWPGLFVTGSAFRGVGIPDCVADGRATAAAAAGRATPAAAQVTPLVAPFSPAERRRGSG